MNPLYEQSNNINMQRLVNSIENFQRNFHGDPKAEVERRVDSPVAAPQPQTDPQPQAKPKKLYLRVPSMTSMPYRKAENLIEIFPGYTPVVYYDAETSRYLARSSGMELTRFLFNELKEYLGENNVIYK